MPYGAGDFLPDDKGQTLFTLYWPQYSPHSFYWPKWDEVKEENRARWARGELAIEEQMAQPNRLTIENIARLASARAFPQLDWEKEPDFIKRAWCNAVKLYADTL